MRELWDFTAPEDDEAERPSDLTLDRLRAGELDAEAAARVEARLAQSDEDRARFEALDRHFDDVDAVDPRRLLAAIRRGAERPATLMERLRAGWVLWVGGLALAAAAVVVWVVLPPAPGPEVPDVVALKGGPVLHVQRRGADGVGEPVASGAPMAPGDTLKFAVTLPASARVRVIGVEADGDRYDAWPLDGDSPVLGPGEQIALDGAVTLDDAPGRETLYLVACPLAVDPTGCRFEGDAPSCPAGCGTDRFVLDKRAP